VFTTVLNHSVNPEKDFDAIFHIYQHPSTADERITALGCLGATNDLKLVHKILNEFILNPDIVKLQDTVYPIGSIATKNPHKVVVYELLWTWIQENWDRLHEKLSASMSLLGRVLQYCVMFQIGDEFPSKVEAWAAGEGLDEEKKAIRVKQVNDAKRMLDQGLEAMKGATKWSLRDETAVAAWLTTNGFIAS
jgi:aminopeptidase 2